MKRWETVLDTLVRERRSALVGYAYLLCGERAEAEDLVQEALIRTFRRGRQARDFTLAESYVRRAIVTTHFNALRRNGRWEQTKHLLSNRDADDASAGIDDRIDVISALGRLTSRERSCIVLRYFDDRPVREIAITLSLSEGAVKRYLSDARARLGPLLGVASTDSYEDLELHVVGK